MRVARTEPEPWPAAVTPAAADICKRQKQVCALHHTVLFLIGDVSTLRRRQPSTKKKPCAFQHTRAAASPAPVRYSVAHLLMLPTVSAQLCVSLVALEALALTLLLSL